MKLTPQQKQIFEQMRTYAEATHYEKVAKDMGLSPKGVQSQLGKLRDLELLTEPEEQKFIVADDAQEILDAAGEDTTVSVADVNLMPRQFFTQIGRSWGINPERLQVMVNTIWQSGDPEDLDHVWKELGLLQVSPDVKRIWVAAWQAYLAQGKPALLQWQPPTVVQEKVAEELEKKQVDAAVEKVEEEGPKEWIVDVKKNEPVKVGEGVGLYTLKEAKELMAMRMYSEALHSGRAEAVAGEKVSDILNALAPYFTKEGKSEEATNLLRELMTEKLTSGLRELAAQIPQEGEKKPWWEILPQITAAIQGLGPTVGPLLREMMGLPPPGAIPVNTGNQPTTQPITLTDATTGQPMTIDLATLLDLRRFESEQKREDDKHKQSMDMMTGLRGFIDKIGTAATRLAGERKR